MKKVLLIDDEANNGWKEVIEEVLFSGEYIDVAEDIASAKEQLNSTKYDLIILDLRFGEHDHQRSDLLDFGGYKILSLEIRSSFDKLNFPTPVLLFTASNKVWNIMEMIEAGADDYYVKEHPNTAYDLDFSRKNYLRLKGDKTHEGIINDLLKIGEKRTKILNKILDIINNSKTAISNNNIKQRIEEKLKIGYGILFGQTTRIEKEKLLYNNEVIAFIVFWSILEEIAKDSFKNNWVMSGNKEGSMRKDKWKLKNNGKIFIEDCRSVNQGKNVGNLIVGIKWDGNKYIAKQSTVRNQDKEINFFTGKVSLSHQIYAVMLLGKGLDPNLAFNLFDGLNKYRNEIDFIHSSVSTIFTTSLSSNQNNSNAFNECIEVLNFINVLLK
jgi:CheY-like chemotaxis protein